MCLVRQIYRMSALMQCQLNQAVWCRRMHWYPTIMGSNWNLVRHRSCLQEKLCTTSRIMSPHRTFVSDSVKRDSSLPKLVYLQYPLRYLWAKLALMRLRFLWDPSFKEDDFKAGTKQAAVLMTDLIRDQNLAEIHSLTTPSGFKQISRDMILSRKDVRLKLLKFRLSDIKKAIPVRVFFIKKFGRKHCVIDMFFVGMRNINDFDPNESSEIQDCLRQYDSLGKDTKPNTKIDAESDEKGSRRIVFAEIFTRFYREYGKANPENWSVAFYKVATFDVLAF